MHAPLTPSSAKAVHAVVRVAAPADGLRRFELLGLRLATGSVPDAAAAILDLAATAPVSVAFVNMHTANLACQKAGYREVLNGFDLVFNDGIGLELAARMRGVRMAYDLPGNLVVPAVLSAASPGGLRVFLLGSRDDVIHRAAGRLSEDFPDVTIAGAHSGYFERADEPALIQRINASNSDVLLVGMGNPQQEEFIARHRAELRVRLAIAVGGLVDIWGGKLTPYPAWATRLRLHWLLRLLQEPRRLWRRYLVGGPVFFWRVWRYRERAISNPAVQPS